MKVRVNGINYFLEHDEIDPDKPVVILLHGFMGSGSGFQLLLPYLEPFCNTVTIDLLGHGLTDGAETSDRFSISRQIKDIHQIITDIFQFKPFLYGYSMGGRIALRCALAHPECLHGLILESTHYGLEEKSEISERKRIDEQRAQAIEKDFDKFVNRWQTLPLFRHKSSQSPGKPDPYEDIQHQQNPNQMAKSLRGCGAAQMSSVKKKLKSLTIPVLLIAGEADSKYVKISRKMHQKLPKSYLSVIPGAGHRVHVEQPQKLATAIEKFLMKND